MFTRIYLGEKTDYGFNTRISIRLFEKLLKNQLAAKSFDRIARGMVYEWKDMYLTFFPDGSSFVKRIEQVSIKFDKFMVETVNEDKCKSLDFPTRKTYMNTYLHEEFEFNISETQTINFVKKTGSKIITFEIFCKTTDNNESSINELKEKLNLLFSS